MKKEQTKIRVVTASPETFIAARAEIAEADRMLWRIRQKEITVTPAQRQEWQRKFQEAAEIINEQQSAMRTEFAEARGLRWLREKSTHHRDAFALASDGRTKNAEVVLVVHHGYTWNGGKGGDRKPTGPHVERIRSWCHPECDSGLDDTDGWAYAAPCKGEP